MAGVGNSLLFTEEEVIAVVKECRGNLSKVGKKLGVSRTTLHGYCKRWPKVQEAFDDERETVLDDVEHKLFDSALDGEPWAVQFLLKTRRFKDYSEKSEHRHININIDLAKLTDEQLQKIANGEDPEKVLLLTDGNTIEGEYTTVGS